VEVTLIQRMNSSPNGSMTPIPTEYKGTLFRSKSEAILARAFDLSEIFWEYEPKEFEVDGWVPDFRIEPKGHNDRAIVLVEYKPSAPTEAYKANLINRIRKLVEGGLRLRDTDCYSTENFFALISGNYRNLPLEVEFVQPSGKYFDVDYNEMTGFWVPFNDLITFNNRFCFSFLDRMEEASKYRFDLKHKGYDWLH
jgi:hypothetical protein